MDVEAAVADVVARFGRLDLAFANAGTAGAEVDLIDQDAAAFDQIVAINWPPTMSVLTALPLGISRRKCSPTTPAMSPATLSALPAGSSCANPPSFGFRLCRLRPIASGAFMGSSQLYDTLELLRGEQLDLLGRLVNIDSGTDDKAGVDAVGRVMHAELERLGLAVDVVYQPKLGDHLVATKSGTSPRVALLVGHLDTVFASGTANARPFRVDGTRAYGPGVYDMCGGLVVLLYALRGLRQASPVAWARLGIRVVLNSDEEPGSDTSRELISANAREAHVACILEPARPGGEYVCARKGVARYVIRVLGIAAHAGNQPHLGANAIAEIAAKAVELHKVTDFASGLTVNVGVIRGGDRVNVVPDWAECEIEARLPTKASLDVVEAALERLRATQLVTGTSVEITGGIKHHPMEPREDAEPLWSILREVGAEIGFEVSAIATGGASDGNTTSQFVPTLDGMGPRGDYAHSPREYIELPSVLERTEALARFLERWVEDR